MKSEQETLSLALRRARTCLHIVCVFRGCHAQVVNNLDPSHVSSACQAEENKCMTTQLYHCCHLNSRSAVSDAGVHLPCTQGFAAHSLFLTSDTPDAPTMSAADNMTAARQKVGPPSILGANPNSYFLKSIQIHKRMDMFNGLFSLYMNGRFFLQKDVTEEFWTENPTALTELLIKDVQWCEQHFRKVSR